MDKHRNPKVAIGEICGDHAALSFALDPSPTVIHASVSFSIKSAKTGAIASADAASLNPRHSFPNFMLQRRGETLFALRGYLLRTVTSPKGFLNVQTVCDGK
jgi:hypothetical protein